mgnify:CR=1 FL=1
MAEPTKTFWQRHPGFDVYSLFWLVLFLILAALGRFYLPLFLPAAVVLVYLLIRLFSKNQQKRQVEVCLEKQEEGSLAELNKIK